MALLLLTIGMTPVTAGDIPLLPQMRIDRIEKTSESSFTVYAPYVTANAVYLRYWNGSTSATTETYIKMIGVNRVFRIDVGPEFSSKLVNVKLCERAFLIEQCSDPASINLEPAVYHPPTATPTPTTTETTIITTIPTTEPTATPSPEPTCEPIPVDTECPVPLPTDTPTEIPTTTDTECATPEPTAIPTECPTLEPTPVDTECPACEECEICEECEVCPEPPAPVDPPVVSFSAKRTSMSLGEPAKFTDESTNFPTKWRWNFGDNTFSDEQNPEHTYAKTGTYSVELIASNDGGWGVDNKYQYITVKKPCGVSCSLEASVIEEPQDDLNMEVGAIA